MPTFTGSITTTGKPEAIEDPAVTAFLVFLEKDMKTHPKRIAGLSKLSIAHATRLTKGVKVTDDERLPEDVSF